MADSSHRPRRIFISYFERDRPTATALRRALACAGHDAWCPDDLAPGDRIDVEVPRQVDAADIVLFLISRSPTSTWQEQSMLIYALDRARQSPAVRVIPVFVDGAERLDAPYGLGHLAALSIEGESFDGVLAGLRRVIAAEPRLDSDLPGVFVAYYGPDRARAVSLRAALNELPCRPWCDVVDLLPGDVWALEIQRAVRRARILILLISRTAHDGWYARAEAIDAIQKMRTHGGRVIIPVLLDGANRHDMPYGLGRIIPGRVEGNDFGQILRAVDRHLPDLQGSG